jgi:hypothetical protein
MTGDGRINGADKKVIFVHTWFVWKFCISKISKTAAESDVSKTHVDVFS